MQAIIATNCDLRLARIIALLLDDSSRIELIYLPDDETYMLLADANHYSMIVGSDDDDFCFTPDADNDADHAYPVSFSMPRFLCRD